MRALLLYLLPIVLLLLALFAIGSRRNSGDEQTAAPGEPNDAAIFLKLLTIN